MRNKNIEEISQVYENAGCWEHMSIAEHLKVWCKEYKEKTAIVDNENSLTYEELDLKVDKLCVKFLNMGIKKGDRVVVQLPNTISFVVNVFALLKAGTIPILALPANRENELDGIFKLAEPTAYIIPDNYLGFDYKKMAANLLENNRCVKNLMIGDENLKDLEKCDIEDVDLTAQLPYYRDTALLLLSGGTTGTPKLIPRTHSGYIYNAKLAAKRCNITSESVYLSVLPCAHNFPLCNPGILGTLSAGGKVVMSLSSSCDEVFPIIEKEKVTITSLVPELVNLWLEVLEWEDSYDLSSLKVIQVGGAMLDEKVAKRVLSETSFKLQQVYGIAEGLICTTSLDDADEVICACQGKSLSQYDDIRIVDENGEDVENGEYGELIVRGPYTIHGYYKLPEVNSKSFNKDGYYLSGDKARFTKDGNIQIGGRVKEMINRAGEKIMPSEIESCLCIHEEIKEAAVIGIKDETLGERICACLIAEDEKELTQFEVNEFLKDKGLASFKMPDEIKYFECWPLTNVGKINKNKLKELVMND